MYGLQPSAPVQKSFFTHGDCKQEVVARRCFQRRLVVHKQITCLHEQTSSERSFHQTHLAATITEHESKITRTVREASARAELERVALLRAQAFHPYPPERAWAGQRMQAMHAEAELRRLLQLGEGGLDGDEQVITLVAVASREQVAHLPALDAELQLPSGDAVLGSLDLFHGGSAPPDNCVLRGDESGAFLANVCVSPGAQRRGVAQELVRAAKTRAAALGAKTLYVHTLEVNEKALALYSGCGFVLEREETVNHAKSRGACLDGIEGRARIVLLRVNL
eukprot:CAMPEP_0114246420 /NCGR_PEP_ID=MMETSP0058-20121206/12451_1 /TAXON_ID=36894 /ORGANISM="Pyramimonas parkeae, CCMP726" /LENGTH=279 /DNA_ID=CAMNT_0001359601 /DNA_START=84 /DNA_END=923 /DNA_ORIENTATION=-